MFKIFLAIPTLLMCITLTGCASGRKEAQLTSPTLGQVIQSSVAKTAAIRAVIDKRVFTNCSPNPSIESLDEVKSDDDVSEIQGRAISRVSDGNNIAKGNLILKRGQSVEGVMQEHISTALQQAGYQLIPLSSASNETLILDVKIRRFWAWDSFGLMAKTVHGVIDTSIIRSDNRPPINTHSHSTIVRITGGHEDVLQQTLDEYRAQLVNELR